MPISLHTHSGSYCFHATGTLPSVLSSAASKHFTTFGLSEHVPRYRYQDLYEEETEYIKSQNDMKLLETRFVEYVKQGREMQKIYDTNNSGMEVLVGCESEYITFNDLERSKEWFEKMELDYIVGSVHHVFEYAIDFSKEVYVKGESDLLAYVTGNNSSYGGMKDAPSYLRNIAMDSNAAYTDATELFFQAYFEAQYEMIRYLKPSVIGHLDLIRLFRPEHALSTRVMEMIRRNVKAIIDIDGLVEINARAWKKGLVDAYPFRDVLRVVQELGGKFTLADDAHGPDQVGMNYGMLKGYLEEMGVGDGDVYTLSRDGSSSGSGSNVVVKRVPDIMNHPFWSVNGYSYQLISS